MADAAPTPELDAARARYLRNLEALYSRDADLAARIDATPFADLPAIEAARDGGWTARARAADGREISLHSRYAPMDEARKLVDAARGEADDALTWVVHGMGLGHHLAVLESTGESPVVLLFERDLSLIKAALCAHDLSGMIAGGRLTLLTSADAQSAHDALGACNADLTLGLRSVTLPVADRLDPTFHAEARRALADALSVARTHLVTLLKTTRTTFENIALNLGAYLDDDGVESIAGAAAGYPAILVAAGPSLARNVEQLRGVGDRAVIIATQTIFRLLLDLGVRPHFVVSLDFHDVSTEFFRGADDVGACTLVAEPKAAWRVLDMYPGRVRVLHHRYADALLREAAPRRAELPAGSTVAHLAHWLAVHLGCEPILLIGQDLAFTDNLFYLPGSPIERIWRPELNRFQTIEMKQWERIVRNRPILRNARSAAGEPVYTDDLLFTYREQFERDFAMNGRTVIQASEGGVALRGATAMPLREAAARFCVRALPAAGFSAQPRRRGGDRCAALEQLRARASEIRRAREIAAETIAVLERLAVAADHPAEFNRLVAIVDSLRVRMGEVDGAYRLVCELSPAAQLRRYGADRRVGSPQTETPEIARRRVTRDREFVAGFLDGCDFALRVLARAVERLELPA